VIFLAQIYEIHIHLLDFIDYFSLSTNLAYVFFSRPPGETMMEQPNLETVGVHHDVISQITGMIVSHCHQELT
jgi:hypothetical protein